MGNYILFGILFIAIIALVFLVIKEKNKTKNTEQKLNNALNDAVKSFNEKVENISTDLEKISAENEALKRKLEFFTEIREDSKNINESENVEERNTLLRKAIEESNSSPIEENSIDSKSNILDPEQMAALNIMKTSNSNLFVTGKAGTGKSFLLEALKLSTTKRTLVVAPTGIAALNVGGATLHSTFGYQNLEEIEINNISNRSIKLKSEKRQVLKELDTLIIDEISMVRADIFDKIDKILKVLNNNPSPFGGKQVIVFGDLFQLPPIANKQEENYLKDKYGNIFFFNSNAYKNGNFGFIELTYNHRQNGDAQYFDILNRIREGKTTDIDLDILNDRFVVDRSKLRRVMAVFPRKGDAEKLNTQELSNIEAKEYIYKAKIKFNAFFDQTPHLENIFPISEELHLKRGAMVMMVVNDMEKRWVNGTIGIIDSLSENNIKVVIDGNTYDVYKTDFTQREAIYADGEIVYRDTLVVEQYPIILAYAITIHKSQGMTYKQIACDLSRCFAPGQAYVALSRCSSLNGLFLLSKVYGTGIHADQAVIDFYWKQLNKDDSSNITPNIDNKGTNSNGYKPWTHEEDLDLIREIQEGIGVNEIANLHQRSIGAIRSRCKKLGL